VPRAKLRGTIQNDILKEVHLARHVDLAADTVAAPYGDT